MLVKRVYPASKRNQSNNLDKFLNDFFGDIERSVLRPVGTSMFNTRPAVNVSETDDSFEIELAAPGLTKKDIKVDVDGDLLKISATKTTEKKEGEEKKYTLREFNFSTFERTFTLPESVDNQSISAKFKDGILSLTLAKKEEAKPVPARTIKIS